jgi:alginate export protein
MKKFAFAAMLALGLVALMAPPAAFAQDEKPFTIHGEVRSRLEYNNNTQDFTDSDAGPGFDDGAGYFPYRIRIAAEGHFTRNVTAWIEFQNTGLFGEQNFFFADSSPRRFNDPLRSGTQLYQGYINIGELWSKDFSLRIGRQEMVYGNEFIFGDEDFYSGISHDGIVGTFDKDKWDLHVFYTRVTEDSVFQFADQDFPPDVVVVNGDADNVETLGGYFTWDITKNSDFDGYIVNVNDRSEGGRWQTIGARWGRDGWDHNGLVWNIEYAIQMGQLVTEGNASPGPDVDAGGQAGEGLIGWNFKGNKNTHRVFGRFEMATGDDVTSTDENEGWVPLFGEIHNRAGRGDWFRVDADPTALGGGISGGLFAWAVGYTGLFNQKHEIGAQYWDYSLEEDNDNPNGDGLGQAFDVWYALNFTKNVALEASYSNLSPDDALTIPAGGADDSVERFYGQIRLRF